MCFTLCALPHHSDIPTFLCKIRNTQIKLNITKLKIKNQEKLVINFSKLGISRKNPSFFPKFEFSRLNSSFFPKFEFSRLNSNFSPAEFGPFFLVLVSSSAG